MSQFLMARASELLLRRRPVSTGLAELDGLIGGLRPGALHVFYGDPQVTDVVLYRVMVEASKRGGVAYLNNTDYYGEKTLIDATTFSAVSKIARVEPLKALSAIRCAAAFNAARQVRAAERLAEAVKKRRKVRLIAVHNASAFLDGEWGEASSALVRSFSILMEAASRVSAPLVATAAAAHSETPEAMPHLPSQVLERASVVVFFRPEGLGPGGQAGQACLASSPADCSSDPRSLVVWCG
ncbi:MAG: hypothetical protein RMJ28_05720 [Nitrososphaerota archaeon]|nr:hypothetical protein [Candidatus Calditenuaceae archaeon]MDW8073712.1 hypothetical protein [Nitrososphaerota archaeon]